MLTLLTEARFWTARDDIVIKDTDFGAFRYQDKKETVTSHIYAEGKRNYSEKRNFKCILDNKRPAKLRDSIKKLEDYLKQHKIVYCRWRDNAVVQMLLCNGLLIHICINIFTGDIIRIAFDKFFVGKLITETVTDALITRMHILIAYNQNQLTFVYLQKPSMKRSAPEKISRMDPKIFNVIINGPQNRTISRQLACNNSFDLVAVWTKSSQNEVYPWRPTVRDQDRANVHIYKLSRTKLEPLCFYWTENDPVNIEFSKTNQNQMHSVEQKTSRKGEVTIEICMYEINKARLQRVAVTSIPLQTQVCCHAFSPDNEKLMLGCIDGSVVLFDESRGITHLVKAAFIPTLVSWHCDSALVMIANERCQFQCFDISLACIKNQMISEDMTPSNLLDLSGYFTSQPTLLNVCWSKKPELALHTETFTQSDCYLLLLFENGPGACLRFFGGTGLKGDVHTSGFTADVLIHKYLNLNHVEKAINMLLCLNWDTYGAMCLISLHKIANYIFKHPLSPEREVQLQKALGSFHVPVKPLCAETEMEFGDQVRDITRKFFQYLLRYRSYEKAFSLAIDINDEDLFMDLHNCAKFSGDIDLASDAYKKAADIIANPDKNSSCSRSSCSECDESGPENSEDTASKKSSEISETQLSNSNNVPSSSSSTSSTRLLHREQSITKERPPLPTFKQKNQKYIQNTNNKSYVPPLPYFSTNTLHTPDVQINIPKPELKVSAFSKNQKRNINAKTKHHTSFPAANLTPDNILLVDPPLPKLTKNYNQHSILHGFPDFIPEINRAQLYHTNFKTEVLNHINNDCFKSGTTSRHLENNVDSPDVKGKGGKIPKALPRTTVPSHQPLQHVVIDVVPKPLPVQQSTDWIVPDQTLGIPLTFNHNTNMSSSHPNYVSRPSKPTSYVLPPAAIYNQRTILKSDNLYNINTPAVPTMIHQHPLTLGNIPPPSQSGDSSIYTIKKSSTSSTLSRTTKEGGASATNSILTCQQAATQKKESGEKNKVKFSDTITVAVVPEIPRKEKSLIDRMKRPNGFHSMVTDPQRELADSLPLCHPNDEYLKDFTPMADARKDEEYSNSSRTGSSTIKVVHFGVV